MRRRLRATLMGVLAIQCMASVAPARAQTYPAKPVRIVVGFTAGGSTDVIARLTAQRLAETLGQPFVVENRTGASGTIADERVVRSPADGYTLLVNTGGSTITPILRKLPYDLFQDLAPVSLIATVPFALVVHPSLPAQNVKELIALARKLPGKMSYGTSGIAGSHHLAGELFNSMAKVNIVHVPFKGASDNVVATAAGQIEMSYASPTAALPLISAKRLRALAVTAARRSSSLPDVPTLHESGLTGYDRPNWYGLLAPAGTPREIIGRLNAAVKSALGTPVARDPFIAQGLEVQTSTPEEFAAFMRRQLNENTKLVKLSGIKAE